MKKLTDKNLDDFVYSGHEPGDEIHIIAIIGESVEYAFNGETYFVSTTVLKENQDAGV